MEIDYKQLAVSPRVWFLPYATEDMVEQVAARCGGTAVYVNGIKAIFTPEQFRPLIRDLRKQAEAP